MTTKAEVDSLIDQECIADALAPINTGFLRTSLRGILTRILCPEPAPPSAPLREPATMVAKDRAAEMAEERVFLDVNIVTLRDEGGKFAVTIWEPEHAADILKDVREWFADALRAYGDELLEKIASEMFGQSVCGNAEFAALDRWQAFVRSYKSSAAKGGIAS